MWTEQDADELRRIRRAFEGLLMILEEAMDVDQTAPAKDGKPAEWSYTLRTRRHK